MMRLFESIVQKDLLGEGTPDSRQYDDDIEDRGEDSYDSLYGNGEKNSLLELEEVIGKTPPLRMALVIYKLLLRLGGKEKHDVIRNALDECPDLIQPVMDMLTDADKSRSDNPTTKIGHKHSDAEKFHGVDNSEGLTESPDPDPEVDNDDPDAGYDGKIPDPKDEYGEILDAVKVTDPRVLAKAFAYMMVMMGRTQRAWRVNRALDMDGAEKLKKACLNQLQNLRESDCCSGKEELEESWSPNAVKRMERNAKDPSWQNKPKAKEMHLSPEASKAAEEAAKSKKLRDGLD